MKTTHIHTPNISAAWDRVNEIFPTDYERDNFSSDRAGYPVYRSTADGKELNYICYLGNRVEVNLENGDTINVWIDSHSEPIRTRRGFRIVSEG